MCAMCEPSSPAAQEFDQRLEEILDRHRFAVQAVRGSTCHAELSYTVGLTAHGLPELVITGMRQQPASDLLRAWGEYVLDTGVVLAGETLECGPHLLEAVAVDHPHEHLLVADRRYPGQVRGLQLAWADDRGRWPWEPGHRARRAGQPLLGTRAPQYCEEHRPDRFDVPPHLA